MVGPSSGPRNIRQHPQFEKHLEELGIAARFLDGILEEIEHQLLWRADEFPPGPRSGIRTVRWQGEVRLKFYFVIRGEVVELLGADWDD